MALMYEADDVIRQKVIDHVISRSHQTSSITRWTDGLEAKVTCEVRACCGQSSSCMCKPSLLIITDPAGTVSARQTWTLSPRFRRVFIKLIYTWMWEGLPLLSRCELAPLPLKVKVIKDQLSSCSFPSLILFPRLFTQIFASPSKSFSFLLPVFLIVVFSEYLNSSPVSDNTDRFLRGETHHFDISTISSFTENKLLVHWKWVDAVCKSSTHNSVRVL